MRGESREYKAQSAKCKVLTLAALLLVVGLNAQSCGQREDAFPLMYYRIDLADKGQDLTWLIVTNRMLVVESSVDDCRWAGFSTYGKLQPGDALKLVIEGAVLKLPYTVSQVVDITDTYTGGVRW